MTVSGRRPPRAKSFLVATAFFLYNACVSRIPVYALRHAYLRRVLRIPVGEGAAVHMGCFVTGRNLSIGPRSVINRDCYLDGRGGLSIGADVSISPGCSLITLTHDPHDPDFAVVPKPVSIGDHVWIGARAMILPGVEVGEGAVVGAGAVVTKPCAPYDIVAGNPARRIGERSKGLRYTLQYFPWYDTDVQP